MVPSDKAKRVTTRHSSIIADQTLARELEKQGAIIMGSTVDKYYCISCAVHRGLCNPREASLRKEHTRKRRF
jgi:small subunit ribosomal protein S26e